MRIAQAWRSCLARFATPKPLGAVGEALAVRYLRRRGYRILARNVRSAIGELDLIALAPDRRTIVFIEVKARRAPTEQHADSQPPPEANITARKRAKLVTLARAESRRRDWNDRPKRIDVVAVTLRGRSPAIRHFENAVRA